jgi:hypothetical protein
MLFCKNTQKTYINVAYVVDLYFSSGHLQITEKSDFAMTIQILGPYY